MTTTAQTVAITAEKSPITTNFGDAELPASEEVNKVNTQDYDTIINERQLKLAALLGNFINEKDYSDFVNMNSGTAASCIKKNSIAYDTLTLTQRSIIKNYITLAKAQHDSELTSTAGRLAFYKMKYLFSQ